MTTKKNAFEIFDDTTDDEKPIVKKSVNSQLKSNQKSNQKLNQKSDRNNSDDSDDQDTQEQTPKKKIKIISNGNFAMFDSDSNSNSDSDDNLKSVSKKSQNCVQKSIKNAEINKLPVTPKNVVKNDAKNVAKNASTCGKYVYPEQNIEYNINNALEPRGQSWIHGSPLDDILNDETDRVTKIVEQLLAIEYPTQRSKKWFEMRECSITASDGGCVLGVNSHEPLYKFYLKKLTKIPFEPSQACYHGTKLEQIATMIYEYRMNVRVEEFGLVKHPKHTFLAASPDGIVGKYKMDGKSLTNHVATMLEIKCPFSRKINDADPFEHIEYYWVQVQLQLECCNLEKCDFWQNTIFQYSSRDEFINDTYELEPFRSKTTMMEKGCLIQLLPKKSMAIIANDPDKYNDIVYTESKFLYPPKIDMTPYDYDLWISDTINNLESTLIKNVLTSYEYENALIHQIIASDSFTIYFMDEIKEIEKNEQKRGKYAKGRKRIMTEFTDDYSKNYIKKLMNPEKNIKLIKFIIINGINGTTDTTNSPIIKSIKNDPTTAEKLLNIESYPEFFNQVDSIPELKFIKQLYQLLKDLEFPRNYCFDKVHYWRFDKTNCTTVNRDRKWFAEKLPIFNKTWEHIKYLKKKPHLITKLISYIDKLPTIEEHFGQAIKDNTTVMAFIEFICDSSNNDAKIEKYYNTH